jgi:hypothetical protein
MDGVALSVIVTVVGGPAVLRRCLDRLVHQIGGRPIEVIVPHERTAEDVAGLAAEFPQVVFAAMDEVQTKARPGTDGARHEIYDRAKAFGLGRAGGEILALLDDSAAPDPDWCDRVLEAHCLPHGAIGGCVEPEARDRLNWAVYLQDFGRYHRPLAEGPADCLTDVNVSYKRQALLAVQDRWRQRYSEATVHGALARQGVTLWQRPQMVVRQDRGPLSLRRLLVERYSWGRLFGSVRARELSVFGRLLYFGLGPVLPLVLVLRLANKTVQASLIGKFLPVLPHLLCLTSAWCLGEFMGNLTGRESSR